MKFIHLIILKLKSKNKAKFFKKSVLFNYDWFSSLSDNFKLVSVQEWNRAKFFWAHIVQGHFYNSEIKLHNKNINLGNTNLILKLDPFLNDGLLRVDGRLAYSNLSFNEKHPLILPYNSEFSRLLVRYHHVRSLHGGIKTFFIKTKFLDCKRKTISKVSNS